LAGDRNQAFVSIPTPCGRNVVAAITHAYGGSAAVEVDVEQPGSLTYGLVPWGTPFYLAREIRSSARGWGK
jgi:filamentous hemagglutinin